MSLDHAAIVNEVKERFARFFADEINPTTDQRDRLGETFSLPQLREMARLGLIGFTSPKAIGGQGRTWEDWGHALEEIGYLCDDAGLPMLLSYRETTINLFYQSGLNGREHLIERYARPAVSGEAFIGWLLTEEGGGLPLVIGNDKTRRRTTLTRHGDRYLLSGKKAASTGGMSCTSWIVYAATEDGSDTVAIMVERDDPGVEVVPLETQGMRSLGLAEVHLDNVALDADRIVAASDGVSHSQIFVNERRVTGSAWLLGRMRSLIERVIADSADKKRLGRSVLDFDTFQSGIGRMVIALETARSTAYRTFAEVETNRSEGTFIHNPMVAIAKYVSTECALEVARIAHRISGGHGYFRKYGIERYVRDFHGLLPILGGPDTVEALLGGRTIFHEQLRRGKNQ